MSTIMLFRKLSRDVDNALAEVQYALDVLLLDGVGLFASAHGRYLGNPVLEPLMAELVGKGAGPGASKRCKTSGSAISSS